MREERSPRQRVTRAQAALALLGCWLALLPLETPAGDTVIQTGTLASPRLGEASGLAASRRRPDVLWALNDSGNRAELFALGLDGADLGRVLLEGAGNEDWEDLASLTLDDEPYLLVADVGDNRSRRPVKNLYLVKEPLVGSAGLATTTAPERRITFRYPDGAADTEAVAFDPRTRRIVLLTKRRTPPRLYSLELDSGSGVQEAEVIGDVTTLPQPTAQDIALGSLRAAYGAQPTALDIGADGSIVVLTYTGVHLFARGSEESLPEAFARVPRTFRLPRLTQAEAMAILQDGAIMVTSEGRGAPLVRLTP